VIASSSNLNDTYNANVGVIMTLTCNWNTTLSAGGCSASVTITPDQDSYDVGDVLTCRADGYVQTYEWSNGITVISTSNEMRLSSEGPFSYTCSVEIEETGCTGSDDISGVGKCRKTHNVLVTIVPLVSLMTT